LEPVEVLDVPNRRVTAGLPGWSRPAGLRVVVPGWPQWHWREPREAGLFAGSFASALVVALAVWGTPLAGLLVAFAFLTHVASAADALRRSAFPGMGRMVPWGVASAGLGLLYAPTVAVAWVVAWPLADPAGEGRLLVNRWAFRHAAQPQRGDWLSYDAPGGLGRGAGRFLGESSSWVDPVLPNSPALPPGYWVLAPSVERVGARPAAPVRVLVRPSQVRGRIWFRTRSLWRERAAPLIAAARVPAPAASE
jgi:hypothetical protein